MPEPHHDYPDGGFFSAPVALEITPVDLGDRVACVLAGFSVLPHPISSASVPSVDQSESVP